MRQDDFRQKSFWLDSAAYQPNPPLSESTRVDVAIIGGGFTGLSAAIYLRRADPSLTVAVLESNVIGYGASGRNGGFAMTLFGLTMSITALRFGKANALAAHRYMERAVDHVGELVHRYEIDCDYEPNGLLTVATGPDYAKRLQHETQLANELGIDDIHYIGAQETRSLVDSPLYIGARTDPHCALINPARCAWGLKRAAEAEGAVIYEQTLVEAFYHGPYLRLKTPAGLVEAGKVIFATNAFSSQFPALYNKQYPVYTYIVLTEPLGPERLEPIGWRGRQGIEDGRNLVHYYRLTKDNRLLMGGGDVKLTWGGKLDRDLDPSVFEDLRAWVQRLYPSLQGVRFTHAWGGPVSVPLDMAPAAGYLGRDKRVMYSLGCVGHGVAMTMMNGQILRDLALEQKTALTELFFVNRWTIPIPPEPLRFPLGQGIRAALRAEDAVDDRRIGQLLEKEVV